MRSKISPQREVSDGTREGAEVLPIAAPAIGEEELAAVRRPLERGWLTQGEEVAAFEKAFAERHQVRHAIATTSCTTALHLSLDALGIGPGDEVVVPAFTWVATANAVVQSGATPVFCDVDPRTFNLDAEVLGTAVTSRTRAVIPVHLFGLCADMDAIEDVFEPGIVVLEDAACAAGAAYRGRPAGGLGVAGAFSFHPRKSITTGEGGMITTDNDELAARLRRRRSHGAAISEEQRHARGAYDLPAFDEVGFNYRMTDLQGALGLVQLRRLDGFIAERSALAERYGAGLEELGWLRPPGSPTGCDHAWQAYVAVVEEDAPCSRDELMASLAEEGIQTRPGTHAVTELRVYKDRLGLRSGQFPVARNLQERTIALPLHNRMDNGDVDRVIEVLTAIS